MCIFFNILIKVVNKKRNKNELKTIYTCNQKLGSKCSDAQKVLKKYIFITTVK